MSKRKQSKQHSRQRNQYVAAGALLMLVVAVVVAVLASRQETGDKTLERISPSSYQEQFVASSSPHVLIDVRTAEEFSSGHIHGAVNIPVEALESRLSEVPEDQPVVVYCRSGNRSAQASQILAQAGYSTVYDLGGIIDWTAQGLPVE